MENKNFCKSCIYDDTIPSIKFNNLGICNYCEMKDISIG